MLMDFTDNDSNQKIICDIHHYLASTCRFFRSGERKYQQFWKLWGWFDSYVLRNRILSIDRFFNRWPILILASQLYMETRKKSLHQLCMDEKGTIRMRYDYRVYVYVPLWLQLIENWFLSLGKLLETNNDGHYGGRKLLQQHIRQFVELFEAIWLEHSAISLPSFVSFGQSNVW